MDVEAVRELLREHGVAVAYLFGSQARGTTHERSDHDVAVLFDAEATLREVGALQLELTRLLGTPVDVIEVALRPGVRPRRRPRAGRPARPGVPGSRSPARGGPARR